MKLHHIGIIAEDIHRAIRNHEAIFGLRQSTDIIEDPVQKVSVVMLSPPEGGLPIELISPLTEDSPISGLLKRRVHLYHLCYSVKDLDEALKEARERGALVVSKPAPARLFHEERIAFIFTPDGYVVELLEEGT